MRLIKKYKNRRLYDTEKSQYITVEELQHYVIEGLPFRVEEAATGKEITSATLLQIIVEMESGATQFLPLEMLRQLIILAHHPMHQAFKNVLTQMFSNMEKTIEQSPYLTDWNNHTEQVMKEWQNFFK